MKNRLLIKKMMYIVSLASMSVVLSLIEIPWIPIPPLGAFLKLDFSEVMILFSILILGYKDTFVVILIRTIGRRMFRGFGFDDWVGEFLAVSASLSIMLAYYTITNILKTKQKPLILAVPINQDKLKLKNIIVAVSITTLFLTVILTAVNFFIGTPMYLSFYMADTIIFDPFTLVNKLTMFNNIWDYFWFCIAAYVPFNIVKGIMISLVFVLLQPRVKYLEL